MFDYNNRVYNIQNTNDLKDFAGTTIYLKVGCSLVFSGGQLINTGGSAVTISGNNTIIDAPLKQIFGSNINLSGTWICKSIHDEWFGGTAGSAKTAIAKPGVGCLYYDSTNSKYIVWTGTTNCWRNVDGTALS